MEFDQKIHFYLAEGLLRTIAVQSDRESKSATETGCSLNSVSVGELWKTVVALLSKLYLPEEVETTPLQAMVILIRNIISVSRLWRRDTEVNLIKYHHYDSDDPYKMHYRGMP